MTITLPLVNAGIENVDAERRRQKALKALKERLKKPDDDDVRAQWDSMDRNGANESIPLIQQQTESNSNDQLNQNLIENINSDNNNDNSTDNSITIKQSEQD